MKICLINNLYKPYNRGGAERIVELIAMGLKDRGQEVCLITTKPLFKEPGIGNQEPGIYYIKSLYYYLDKLPKFIRLVWHLADIFDVRSYFKIKSILKKEKCDLVMTHNLTGVGFLVPLAIKSSGIKHIHVLHDIQLLHPSGLMMFGQENIISGAPAIAYQKICRLLIGSPDMIISPSQWLMDLHAGKKFFISSEKIILPNPVPRADAMKDESKKKETVFNFLYIGQIEKHKGIIFLINAFKKSSQKGAFGLKARLTIAGPGSETKQAANLIKDCRNIEFLGAVARAEVEKLMLRSSVFITPSLCYENSPAVIYEAFAAGLPVIGADLGGISELLADGRGILFKPGDENDLINKMIWALDNPQELVNINEKGREIIKQFSVEKYVNILLNTL